MGRLLLGIDMAVNGRECWIPLEGGGRRETREYLGLVTLGLDEIESMAELGVIEIVSRSPGDLTTDGGTEVVLIALGDGRYPVEVFTDGPRLLATVYRDVDHYTDWCAKTAHLRGKG